MNGKHDGAGDVVLCCADQEERKTLETVFTGAGFRCICVKDWQQIVDGLRDGESGIVVLDADWPGCDARNVLTSIRSAGLTLDRTVFAAAITADRSAAEALMEAGADAVFSRPFNETKLLAAVQRARHRQRAGSKSSGRSVGIPFAPGVLLQTTPPSAGVIVIRDKEGRAILVEHTGNIRQRLQWYLIGADAKAQEVKALADTTDFVLSDDEKTAGAVFDHEVGILNDFPRFSRVPPAGSCHESADAESITMTDHAMSLERPLESEELDTARRQYEENPDDPQAKDWYAFLCYRFGHHEEAVRHFAELIDGGSTRPEHYFYLGCALTATGNYAIAVEMWEKAAQIAGEGRMSRKCLRRIEQVRPLLEEQADPCTGEPPAGGDEREGSN